MTHRPRNNSGFSLIELVVAVLFVGLLMAGMLQIFATSIQSFYSQQETLGAQRMSRLAFDQLSDDFQQAGYMYPDRSTPPWMTGTAAQKTFLITPDVTFTAKRPDDANPALLVDETITGDEVVFLRDMPLHYTTTLSADIGPIAGVTATLPIKADPAATDPVLQGDIAIIWDQKFEFFFVNADLGSGTSVAINPNGNFVSNQWLTGANGEVFRDHKKDTLVTFVRPNQVVRYTLQPIALDPSIPKQLVPCLVRQQAPYPTNPATAINWAGVNGTVLAENVSAFRLDISPDGGSNWTRAATWAAWKTALEPKLKAQSMNGFQGMDTNPLWIKFAHMVFRLDINSRTTTRRTDFDQASATPTRAYRNRQLTMMLTPRNYALGT